MSMMLENQSFEGNFFQNQSFNVTNNPIYQVDMTGIHEDLTLEEQGGNVEVSEQSINGGTTNNHMNNIDGEIRILIDDEIILSKLPAATNVIVISHSSREHSTRLMEITLGITGQAAVSLMAYTATAATTSSSKSLRGLDVVVAANAVGFIATFLGIWFSEKKKQQKKQVAAASLVAGKIGVVAAACAVILAMGTFLPANVGSMWFIGFVCLFPAAAVVFA